MFTGIVVEVGFVHSLSRDGGAARLSVAAPGLAEDAAIGDSIAVDGACLTVTAAGGGRMEFDVVPETLRKTTLGELTPGRRVNLEGALRVGDRLSGHFVSGHVDGVGEIADRRDEAGQVVLRVDAPPSVAPYLVEKGSIAVAGVSLTTWQVEAARFSVAIVPHTLSATTLGGLRRGDRVNLEADLLARHVARLLGLSGVPREGGVTPDTLRAAGWDG